MPNALLESIPLLTSFLAGEGQAEVEKALDAQEALKQLAIVIPVMNLFDGRRIALQGFRTPGKVSWTQRVRAQIVFVWLIVVTAVITAIVTKMISP